MSEPRWHEMTYTEIGVLFRELTADRDRWRKVADDLANGAWEQAKLNYYQAVRGE